MTRLGAAVLLSLLWVAPAARAQQGDQFWGELAQPGLSRYRELVAEGRAHLEAEPSRPERAVPPLERAVALLPGQPSAHLELGRAHHELRRYRQALTHLEKARALGLPPMRAREVLERIALCRSALSDFAGALEAYDRTLELLRREPRAPSLPGRVDPRVRQESMLEVNAGEALMGLGRLDESIRRYRRAASLDANHASAWFGLGVALARREQFHEAFEAVRRGLQVDPQVRSLRPPEYFFAPAEDEGYFLGLIELVRRNRNDAVRWLRRYLEVAPKSPYAASARMLLGDAEKLSLPPKDKGKDKGGKGKG